MRKWVADAADMSALLEYGPDDRKPTATTHVRMIGRDDRAMGTGEEEKRVGEDCARRGQEVKCFPQIYVDKSRHRSSTRQTDAGSRAGWHHVRMRPKDHTADMT